METVFKQQAKIVDLRMLDSGILSQGKYFDNFRQITTFTLWVAPNMLVHLS